MEETWIAILGGLLATLVSGFSSWFFTKRKYNTEVDANLIKNMQDSLDFYKSLADDNKARLEVVLKENEDLRREVGELRSMVDNLNKVLSKYGLEKIIEEKV